MITLMTIEPTYSTEQVAALLGVHVNTVKNWTRRGLISSSRVSGSHAHRYTQSDIDNRIVPTMGRPRKDNHQ